MRTNGRMLLLPLASQTPNMRMFLLSRWWNHIHFRADKGTFSKNDRKKMHPAENALGLVIVAVHGAVVALGTPRRCFWLTFENIWRISKPFLLGFRQGKNLDSEWYSSNAFKVSFLWAVTLLLFSRAAETMLPVQVWLTSLVRPTIGQIFPLLPSRVLVHSGVAVFGPNK